MCVERINFSQRLQKALRDAGYAPDSPTQLARNFNSRFDGKPVTVHGARKWLLGESIPTQEKLRVLSDWLEVPAEWLRFGTASVVTPDPANNGSNQKVIAKVRRIVDDFHQLDEHHQELFMEMMQVLLKSNRSVNEHPDAQRTRNCHLKKV